MHISVDRQTLWVGLAVTWVLYTACTLLLILSISLSVSSLPWDTSKSFHVWGIYTMRMRIMRIMRMMGMMRMKIRRRMTARMVMPSSTCQKSAVTLGSHIWLAWE